MVLTKVYLQKHDKVAPVHVVKAYVEVEVYLHPFLTSELYAFSFSFISPPLYH
jgi:hypothetical protein